MSIPSGLQPLIDSDILRYEISFAAETGWKAVHEGELPPWEYVKELLHQRIENIKSACNTDKEPTLYLTEGRTFRYDLAKRKPYKGQRKENKPFHFDNLTARLKHLDAKVITRIEADDALSIDHCNSNGTTILVSRDKDLMQCPGYFYSWELGRQPSWGPGLIDRVGGITLSSDNKKIKGQGEAFFWSQVLTGDTADNTPGLPGFGPVATYNLLAPIVDRGLKPISASPEAVEEWEATTLARLEEACRRAYTVHYSPIGGDWLIEMQEQVDLHWLVRELNKDGSPILRKININD